MSIQRGWARLLMLTWAVVQLAASPVLTLLDGDYALRNGNVASHVEGHSSKSCQPPHSADCALCQSLASHVASSPPAPAFEWPIALRHRHVIERSRNGFQSVALDLSHSRAPPVA